MDTNIILISENNDYLKILQKNFKLQREHDYINLLSPLDIKRIPKSENIILIPAQEYSNEDLSKIIKHAMRYSPDSLILPIISGQDSSFLSEFFNSGIYDYINSDIEETDCEIRIKNCLKLLKERRINSIRNYFLGTSDSINSKTGLFKRKALKEIFEDLDENNYIRNSIFCILTLDSKAKTKISFNRLSGILKKRLRKTDIIASGTDKFYIILCDTKLDGAKALINEISDTAGENLIIRAGLCNTGINDFDTIEKLAKDSLQSAILNNTIYGSLEDKLDNVNNDTVRDKHAFKLFRKAFDNKLNNIIKPVFFRCEKDFAQKLRTGEIIQYANNIECAFCIKNRNMQSELILRYNGITKIYLTISHSGLDTSENTKEEIPLNQFSEKTLVKYMKQLLQEYKEGVKNAGNR